MVREGGTKKAESSGRVKRPNNFWAPFNLWWREKYDATGVRPSVAEMREWYAQNAHAVWPPGTMPALDDMLKIAKGLRSIEQVQTYFRSYRKGLKTRKDGEPASPDAGTRKRRQNVTGSQGGGGATANTFIAALHNAARQYQQYQLQQALVAGGAATATQGRSAGGAVEQPDSQNWSFSMEMAAAAAMGAEGHPSDDEALTATDDDGDGNTPTYTAAAAATGTTATTATVTVTGSATAAGVPDADRRLHAGEVQQATEAPFEDYGGVGVEAGASSDEHMADAAEPRAQAWMGYPPPQHPAFAASASAHRRAAQTMHHGHASAGGAFPGAPAAATRRSESSGGMGPSGSGPAPAAGYNSVGGGTGGSGMQTVTCRRTRIRTSAGGAMWQQEVLEQVEVGVMPAPGAMPPPAVQAYAMPPQQQMHAYAGMPLPDQEELALDGDPSALAPPRKQLRCGDRAVVSLGGADEFPAADGQQGQMLADAGPEMPGRRFVQSCGGFGGHAEHLRLKVPTHGMSVMALSDGGAAYGAQPGSAHRQQADHAAMPFSPQSIHAPPPHYRAPAGSVYGGAPAAYPPYPHAPPAPYPHPGGHAPYPMYGYPPHPAYAHMPPPPYVYYASHPPPPGYPPMPAYHMAPYMPPPYGMHPHMYGHYPPPPEAAGGHPSEKPLASAQPPGLHRQPPPHLQPASRQVASPVSQRSTPNARAPAAAGAVAAPRPLQLLELPPVPCGLMAEGMESLSHSDLAGLSGLSELGQQAAKEAEAAGHDEVVSPDRHRHRPHHAHHGHGQPEQHPTQGPAQAGAAVEEPVTLIRREVRGSCPGDNILSSPSDGGAPDGVASLYYQTPKAMHGKPNFKDIKPRPMTIHVMQEEMVVMPLAGAGNELGEALHSPTGSLNLLENLGAEEGMEVAGMWGPVA